MLFNRSKLPLCQISITKRTVELPPPPPQPGYGQFTAAKNVSADQFHVAISRGLSTRALLLALAKFMYYFIRALMS